MQAAEGLFRFSYFDLSPLHCPFPIFDQIFIKIMNWQFRSQKGNLSWTLFIWSKKNHFTSPPCHPASGPALSVPFKFRVSNGVVAGQTRRAADEANRKPEWEPGRPRGAWIAVAALAETAAAGRQRKFITKWEEKRPHLDRTMRATSPRNHTCMLVHLESCLQGLEIPSTRRAGSCQCRLGQSGSVTAGQNKHYGRLTKPKSRPEKRQKQKPCRPSVASRRSLLPSETLVPWFQAYEFMIMNLCHWIIWFHNHEFMREFSARKNNVKSWLNSQKLTYEIMIEFMDLKSFWIQLQICFSEGKCFIHPR